MTYYESVETVTFTRARALKELQNHGIPESEYPVFFSGVRLEFGNYPTLRFSSLTGDFVPLIGNP